MAHEKNIGKNVLADHAGSLVGEYFENTLYTIVLVKALLNSCSTSFYKHFYFVCITYIEHLWILSDNVGLQFQQNVKY